MASHGYLLSFFTLAALSRVFYTQTIDVVTDQCSILEVEFTVYNGFTGGKVFIEGIKNTDNVCWPTLSGAASQTFIMTYDYCQVTPVETVSSKTIEFTIVVQQNEAYNLQSDPRYRVVCSFAETKQTVQTTLISQSGSKNGTELITHSTNPLPRLNLFRVTNVTSMATEDISYGDLVTMGDQLLLKIDLDIDVPDYTLLVKQCFLEAKTISSQPLNSLPLLDTTTHCALYEAVFPSLQYKLEERTSADDNLFNITTADTMFKAFIPTLQSVKLAYEQISLIIGCQVTVCFSANADCDKPDCGGGRRRKRENTEEGEDIPLSTEHLLYDGFRLEIGGRNGTVSLPDNPNDGVTPLDPGTNDVCIDRKGFWALVLSLLFLLLCAVLTTCCVLFQSRRNQRRSRRQIVDKESSSSSTTSTEVTSSQSRVSRLHYLPRYVAFLVKSSSGLSGNENNF